MGKFSKHRDKCKIPQAYTNGIQKGNFLTFFFNERGKMYLQVNHTIRDEFRQENSKIENSNREQQ